MQAIQKFALVFGLALSSGLSSGVIAKADGSPYHWQDSEEIHQSLLEAGEMGAYLALTEKFIQSRTYQFGAASFEITPTASANYFTLKGTVRYQIPQINHPSCPPGAPCPPRPSIRYFELEFNGQMMSSGGTKPVLWVQQFTLKSNSFTQKN